MKFPYGYPNVYQLQLYQFIIHKNPLNQRAVRRLPHSVLSKTQFIMGTADRNLTIPSLIPKLVFYITITIMPGCDLF